ncbi:chitin binding domain-containing protein [Burkholderia pseudomallei]|uniref:lytic polysaccharide monooxygenase n=1 Tax=Burkholderia pseudomallei TaxID=28450 RepID=UPI0021F760DA|nr:lytic polysaccharide monooxygenase [Burkholderia pseudomallei]MCW0164868.1 lytic polysaccharide monooxygenase [Burkholderia pseudomallei]CAJ3072059.1 chitin binding domain-containing protein [Burkholderia pseudomallei]CAJ4506287.1 chitin binding domain-containing protein [Burkholderia pseudomallei]CAJ4892897.1 chitin binding domain-containing protein [Burkholderia pseudomallei]CAJ7992021.1 chitin binding domain-containing protein [Burkholderia pseudomallei]
MKSLFDAPSSRPRARAALTLGAAATLTASFAALLAPMNADAHGAVGFPIARQYQCRLEGGYWDPPNGSAIPHDDCRAAYRAGNNSAYPFTQWNEVSANPVGQGNDLAQLKAAVPDGLLCAGGDTSKAGLDKAPASVWRKTQLTPNNGHIELQWENTTAHNPARMRVFISKPSYDPSRPLRWDDLQQIYDAPAPAPVPANGAGHLPGSIQSFYKLDVTLPAGRTGDAVLYSYWQRIDAGNEGFFNCSDVTIAADERASGFPWVAARAFVEPGIAPRAGQQVRFRVMINDARGAEVVDVRQPITPYNAERSVWAKQIADQVNGRYGNIAKIGVRSGNTIYFDATNLDANKVWLQPNYSSALSIVGAK